MGVEPILATDWPLSHLGIIYIYMRHPIRRMNQFLLAGESGSGPRRRSNARGRRKAPAASRGRRQSGGQNGLRLLASLFNMRRRAIAAARLDAPVTLKLSGAKHCPSIKRNLGFPDTFTLFRKGYSYIHKRQVTIDFACLLVRRQEWLAPSSIACALPLSVTPRCDIYIFIARLASALLR
jgi:hypothetical protein